MNFGNVQVELLEARAAAAKSALRYFKDIKAIKSTNNPFAGTTASDQKVMKKFRNQIKDSIAQTVEDATHFNLGNCDEKGKIVYSSLIGNPRISIGSVVTLCEAIDGYDHVFVVVSDKVVSSSTKLNELPVTAMIVDGWTQDWYFPHLSFTTATSYGLSNLPNPRQFVVRRNISKHQFRGYHQGRLPPMVPSNGVIRQTKSKAAFGAI